MVAADCPKVVANRLADLRGVISGMYCRNTGAEAAICQPHREIQRRALGKHRRQLTRAFERIAFKRAERRVFSDLQTAALGLASSSAAAPYGWICQTGSTIGKAW